MTSPSIRSVEMLSGGAGSPQAPPQRSRWLVVVPILLGGAAAAAVLQATEREAESPEAFVEALIDTWNQRDAQAVSSLTCDYIPAFVPAGIIEDYMALTSEGQPIVGDHDISSEGAMDLAGRDVQRVSVRYVTADGDATRERNVFVRVRDDGEMCVAQFVSW